VWAAGGSSLQSLVN